MIMPQQWVLSITTNISLSSRSISDLMNLITGPTLSPNSPNQNYHWHFREISNMIYDNWDILKIDIFIRDSFSPSQFSNQTTAGRQTGVPMLAGSSFSVSFWRSSSLSRSSLLFCVSSSSLVQVDLCIVTLYLLFI